MRELLPERLSQAMRASSMNIFKLSENAKVPVADIERYLENGIVPSEVKVEKLAKALGVTLPYLMDWDSLYPYKNDEEAAITYQIIGAINMNEDGRIQEDFLDAYETIPEPWLLDKAPHEFFVFQASKEALVPAVLPGDLLFCRKAPVVNDGCVAIVLFQHAPAGLYVVQYDNSGSMITLETLTPDSEAIHLEGEALAQCHVIGRVERVLRVL